MNNLTVNVTNRKSDLVVSYYSLSLIVVGTSLNLLTFFIFFRPAFRDTRKRPTIHYMRAIAIFDILMLYGWNLDHYLGDIHGFELEELTIPTCKFFSFLNYFTAEVSAWLRVFICLDRYLSLSRLQKTWFSRERNVLIVILCIIIVFVGAHSHFFIFVCYLDANGKVRQGSLYYKVYPMMDYVNLVLYNCLPFIFMSLLNSGVIYHLVQLRKNSSVQNSRIQHRSIYITLVITTFLFLFMTIPVTVLFAFFNGQVSYFILHLFDSILYTYHILSFPLYMITFTEFRHEFLRLITCNRWPKTQLVTPSTVLTKNT